MGIKIGTMHAVDCAAGIVSIGSHNIDIEIGSAYFERVNQPILQVGPLGAEVQHDEKPKMSKRLKTFLGAVSTNAIGSAIGAAFSS